LAVGENFSGYWRGCLGRKKCETRSDLRKSFLIEEDKKATQSFVSWGGLGQKKCGGFDDRAAYDKREKEQTVIRLGVSKTVWCGERDKRRWGLAIRSKDKFCVVWAKRKGGKKKKKKTEKKTKKLSTSASGHGG